MPIPSFDDLLAIARQAYLDVDQCEVELDRYRFDPLPNGTLRIVQRGAPAGRIVSERQRLLDERKKAALCAGIRQKVNQYFGARLGTRLADAAGISEAHWTGPCQIRVIVRERLRLNCETITILRMLHDQDARVNPVEPRRALNLSGLDARLNASLGITLYSGLDHAGRTAARAELFRKVTDMDAFVQQRMRREDLGPLLGAILTRHHAEATQATGAARGARAPEDNARPRSRRRLRRSAPSSTAHRSHDSRDENRAGSHG